MQISIPIITCDSWEVLVHIELLELLKNWKFYS